MDTVAQIMSTGVHTAHTSTVIGPLRELMLSTDRMLSEAASEAVRAIMARQ